MGRKLISALLLLLILAVFAACGREQTPATTTVTTAPAQTTAPETEPEATEPRIAPPMADKLASYEQMTQDCGIPIVSVYTQDRAEVLSRTEYVTCVVDVFNCDDEFLLEEAAAGIRVRGNSSAYYGDENKIRAEKAPYRIKFEQKTNMLGLNDGAECKSWVLLKADWDLVRNDLAFRMGRAIMDGHGFCSDSTFVHLYVNGEFFGIYLLCEQSQVNENRVDIHEPEAEETGTDVGYYLELDNYATVEPDNHYFTLNYANGTLTDIQGVTRALVGAEYSIKSEVTDDAQVKFISRYMNSVYSALYEACVNGKYYAVYPNGSLAGTTFTSSYQVADRLLDLESVVNMYILYEIVCDHDCGEGSFYMCIDFTEESPKLQFTSPWDFNWAYDIEPDGGYFAAAFCTEEFAKEFGDRSNPWFILLMKEQWFVDMVREKWTALRSSGALDACLAAEEAYLTEYEAELSVMDPDSVSYARDRLEWVRARFAWLDSQWLTQ